MRDIAGVREVDIDRALAAGGGAFTTLVPYIRMLATDAIGWPVFAAAVAGVVAAIRSDWRRGLLLVAFPIPFLLFLSHTVPMSRYTDAMLPMIAVAAAFAARRRRPDRPGEATARRRPPGRRGCSSRNAHEHPIEPVFRRGRYADAGARVRRARSPRRIVRADPAIQRAPPYVERGPGRSTPGQPGVGSARERQVSAAARAVAAARPRPTACSTMAMAAWTPTSSTCCQSEFDENVGPHAAAQP